MIGHKDIVFYYELLYKKKYGNETYVYKPTPKAEIEINNFLSFLEKKYKLISLGEDFLSRYFSFQFKRTENLILKRFSSKDKSGRIQIYDIIGKSAIQYWMNRDINFDFIVEINTVIPKRHPSLERVENKSEEFEKKRFHNTDRGFLNCIEKTSLFNHKSTNCVLCTVNKEACKCLLKKNYYNIYKDRGYVTTT